MKKRRRQVPAASFLAEAFAVTAGFAVQGHARVAQYRRMLDNTYQHAFTELVMAVGKLDAVLRKVTYATGPGPFSALYVQAYNKTLAAQSALGELPYDNAELGQTVVFLVKTGGYAMVLARDAYDETTCIEAHRETLRGLTGATSALSGALRSLLAGLDTGTTRPEDMETVQAWLSNATESGELPAGSSFQMVEANFSEVPALIYDGPFSDHLSGRTPKMLEGLPQVPGAEAHRTVATLLGLREDIFILSAQGEGQLPTWGFPTLVNGGELYVEATRQGGQVLQVLSSRPVDETSLSTQEGWQRAAEFLSEWGYQGMDPGHSVRQDGILTIHFASHQSGMYCYPDLIKVDVALDIGDVVSSESEGYLMNHGDRTLPAPAVSEAEAAIQVDSSFIVLVHQLALVPTGGECEVLCHKFKCQNASGGHVLVHVDATDDRQERILLPQEDENRMLVI